MKPLTLILFTLFSAISVSAQCQNGDLWKVNTSTKLMECVSPSALPISSAQQTALDTKAPKDSPTFTGTVAGITKSMVGLGGVDNTSDAGKPISTATQTALDLKSPLASPTFTGTVGGVTSTMVGLGNVSNTSDASKPVSTAQQTALDLKANLASPTFTGTVTISTVLKIATTTVGGLPTCNAGASGSVAIVTDALLPAFLATVGAGGAVKTPVLCNSSNWVVF